MIVPVEEVFQSKGRVKILKVLAEAGELNVTTIARRAHVNHNTTRDYLHALVKTHILQEKTFGRVRIYRFRMEDTRARAIKNLFDIWEQDAL